MDRDWTRWLVILVGLVVGLVFGVLSMQSGTASALVVLATGAAGAAVAWLLYGVATRSLDFGGAWRALRRK